MKGLKIIFMKISQEPRFNLMDDIKKTQKIDMLYETRHFLPLIHGCTTVLRGGPGSYYGFKKYFLLNALL